MSSDSTSTYISPLYVKPLASAGICYLLDQYVLKNPDMRSSLYFAGAVGAGTAFSSVFSSLDLTVLPTTEIYEGKVLSQRIIELTIASGSTWAVNKFALNNDFIPSIMSQKFGVIVASEICAEYLSDYLGNRPLSYLTNPN